jgi:hypothetical protein
MRVNNPTQIDLVSCGPIAMDVMIGDCFGGRESRPAPKELRILQLGLLMGYFNAQEVNEAALTRTPPLKVRESAHARTNDST